MIRYTKTASSAAPDTTHVVAELVQSVSVCANAPVTRNVALYCTLTEHESLSITFTQEAAESLYRGLKEALGKDASKCIACGRGLGDADGENMCVSCAARENRPQKRGEP